MKLTGTLVLSILTIQSIVISQEYVNKELGFAITLPTGHGWSKPVIKQLSDSTVRKPVELQIEAVFGMGRKISIVVVDVDDNLSLETEESRASFKNALMKNFPPGFHAAAESVGTFAAVPSYAVSVRGLIEDHPMSVRTTALMANGRQYNFTAYSADSTDTIPPEAERTFASFRFTEPPVVPKVNASPEPSKRSFGMVIATVGLGIVMAYVMMRVFGRKKSGAA